MKFLSNFLRGCKYLIVVCVVIVIIITILFGPSVIAESTKNPYWFWLYAIYFIIGIAVIGDDDSW